MIWLNNSKYKSTWIRSWRCGCLVTWFRYQMIAETGNKTAEPSWSDPYSDSEKCKKYFRSWQEISYIYADFINSLAPGRYDNNFECVISEHMLQIKFMSTYCEIHISWMPETAFDDEPTLVKVMAWCHQATSHYLSQCWPRSMSPYSITRPQWGKIILEKMAIL